MTDHLEELRRRLLWSGGWFLLLSFFCGFFVDPILTWLAKPIGRFVFTSPTEAFFVHLKLAFGLGTLAAFPVFLYNGWRFIEEALHQKERSLVKSMVPAASILFGGGVVLALYGVAPLAARFLLQFQSETLIPMISVQSYMSFLFWMILGFGILFQVPLVIVVLVSLGVMDLQTLRRYRKHVIVCLLILSALMTPGPDVVSQLMMTLPSYILFESSILFCRIWVKRPNGEDDENK